MEHFEMQLLSEPARLKHEIAWLRQQVQGIEQFDGKRVIYSSKFWTFAQMALESLREEGLGPAVSGDKAEEGTENKPGRQETHKPEDDKEVAAVGDRSQSKVRIADLPPQVQAHRDHHVQWGPLVRFLQRLGVTGLDKRTQRCRNILPAPTFTTGRQPRWFRLGEAWEAAMLACSNPERMSGIDLAAGFLSNLRPPDWDGPGADGPPDPNA